MKRNKNIEERFEELQERLEKIEKTIPLAYDLVHLSERLNIPLNLYHDQVRQMVVLNGLMKKVPEIEKDDLCKVIIQSLVKGEANISQLTARVRAVRGKASRRIIADRLEHLEKLFIVEHHMGGNNEKVYKLKYAKG